MVSRILMKDLDQDELMFFLMVREHILQFLKKKLENDFREIDIIKRYLPIKHLLKIMKNILMMYEGEEMQIFFKEMFLEYKGKEEFIRLGNFIVMLMEIYRKMKIAGYKPTTKTVPVPKKRKRDTKKGRFYPWGNPYDHHSFKCLGEIHGHLQDRKKTKGPVDWFLWSDYSKLETPITNISKKQSRKRHQRSSSSIPRGTQPHEILTSKEMDDYWKRNYSPVKDIYKRDRSKRTFGSASSRNPPRVGSYNRSDSRNSTRKKKLKADSRSPMANSSRKLSRNDKIILSNAIVDLVKNGKSHSPLYKLVKEEGITPKLKKKHEESEKISRDLAPSLDNTNSKDQIQPPSEEFSFNNKRISKLLKSDNNKNQLELFSLFDQMNTMDNTNYFKKKRGAQDLPERHYQSQRVERSGHKSLSPLAHHPSNQEFTPNLCTDRSLTKSNYKRILDKIDLENNKPPDHDISPKSKLSHSKSNPNFRQSFQKI